MSTSSPLLPRKALIEWISSLKYTTFVTLTFNPNKYPKDSRSMSLLSGGIKTATKSLMDWDAQLNRQVIGPKWLTKRSHRRLVGKAFVENLDTNVHWHIVCTPPIPRQPDRPIPSSAAEELMAHEEFSQIAHATWLNLCYNGDTEIVPISDHRGIAEYITKQCYRGENYEGFVPLGPRLS